MMLNLLILHQEKKSNTDFISFSYYFLLYYIITIYYIVILLFILFKNYSLTETQKRQLTVD